MEYNHSNNCKHNGNREEQWERDADSNRYGPYQSKTLHKVGDIKEYTLFYSSRRIINQPIEGLMQPSDHQMEFEENVIEKLNYHLQKYKEKSHPVHNTKVSGVMSSLRDIMAKGRSKKNNKDVFQLPEDPYEGAYSVKSLPQSLSVGYVHDSIFDLHYNPWDEDHIEKPERLIRIMERLKETRLLERCKQIPSRIAEEHEILEVHDESLIQLLKSSSQLNSSQEFKNFASKSFYSVFLNKDTYKVALTAAGSGLALSDALYSNENKFWDCSYTSTRTSFYEEGQGINKILIVDIDVHHGQGTQRTFIDNPNVLYFSIHRYEYGNYWPHLRESNFTELGEGNGRGFNLNVPLNEIGMGDSEYISILHRGYDAAIGCPEGEMSVSPAFYGHLIKSLHALSMGRLLVILEGGYFIESLAEGVAMTLRAILGAPCVPLSLKSWKLSPSCVESILNVYTYSKAYWKQLNWMGKYNETNLKEDKLEHCFVPNIDYLYERGTSDVVTPEGFEIREDYYTLGPEKLKYFNDVISEERLRYSPFWEMDTIKVNYVYDEIMMKHSNLDDSSHPECPNRIKNIFEMHDEFGLLKNMNKIQTERRITNEEILLVHGDDHIKDLYELAQISSQEDREAFADQFESIFFNSHSHDCAHFAAGAFLDLIDSVLLPQDYERERKGGIAMIRPPGHHAEPEEFMGFSILNNVAIGAAYAKKKYGLKRILIFDWDVHHGNGIQKAFYDDPSVLYISIHRFDGGSFFPCKDDAGINFVGKGDGEGFNVNIPWDGPGVGDPEYLAAFFQIVMPIAYEFEPELVLVSAGFDAAINDPSWTLKLLNNTKNFGDNLAISMGSLSLRSSILTDGIEYVPSEYGFHYSSSFVNTMSSSPSTMKSATSLILLILFIQKVLAMALNRLYIRTTQTLLNRTFCSAYDAPGKTTITILNEDAANLMVDSYDTTGFRLNNNIKAFGPIVLLPKGILPEIIVIGYGSPGDPIDPKTILKLKQTMKLNVEVLPTNKAVTTYNFLSSEGRAVAGAFIPPSFVDSANETDTAAFISLKSEGDIFDLVSGSGSSKSIFPDVKRLKEI
ncbi:Histone deacetylase 7,Histone deacetylase 9,Polyamine deacetylase HDAC10,Histone deacetylase 18,Histone deacetylase 6,Histone deacetylase 4,Histone deacetylase 5 [Lepeophtheirus salmonis]|uniref:Histone deacetylase 7,Histone deacetylase 9,Polyamine deacetylase HDAC10,Histone deacetylase 18,Histone deacetylase 6,Histone deacetylase 4,Histone deacetylase 5 n=1 Tax=Lepeophtheirus salmonis TaxID=72036 RepID=A0A7R8D2C5_LEPSM|nr:Histone deacetylase 7,Histone deacetylase 9,Polyamine deacetylase HDAC10,Histone deacetylase 18,Histone deacetylase 6,Histone deacetylase 4,Histone deacetylase 5 [Lepeophtheirus salmonis]CAF3004058.1 Histone deacetylase 7,Histone deacetylase 9,Polyamine deacetylase HDAC10,Histone deacetylase 18,Histone deacetylase 6,Histone deacetylase 4,Histone deacetylase 5 [Lepeophtheirus salmonis]